MESFGYISAEENEFFAEETLIEIVPNFDRPAFACLSGKFGPFEPQIPVTIPLWLALTLRRKGKCVIKIPDWLSVDILTEIKAKESDDETFYELPFHYIEIAFSLLNTAKEEIEEPDKVKSLVKDIMTIRMDRTRIGLLGLSKAAENAEVIRCIGMNNISAFEILKIKGFLTESLSSFMALSESSPVEDTLTSGRPGGSGGGSGDRPAVQPMLKRFRGS